MRILSHMGIYGYSVVLFVLMGCYSLCDWFFRSCGNCLILGVVRLSIFRQTFSIKFNGGEYRHHYVIWAGSMYPCIVLHKMGFQGIL
jgi:hypothetical protein